MPRLTHPPALVPVFLARRKHHWLPGIVSGVAVLILSALACDASSLPIPQSTDVPLDPTATRRVLGTSLPGSTAIPETQSGEPPVEVSTGTAGPTEPGPTAAPTFTSPPGDIAVVTRIVDGDTFKATQNGVEVTVRYIGINTPETDEPCYAEATAANQGMIMGQTVTLVKDVSETDQYDRLLRYVYAGGILINAELVRQGWAEAAKYPPDVAHADEFHRLAVQARATNLGCWPTGIFGPPAPAAPTSTLASETSAPATPASGKATSTPGPQSTIAVCDCDYNKYNCASFSSRADAQACFDYCVEQGAGDVHLMDGNSNGLACEAFP